MWAQIMVPATSVELAAMLAADARAADHLTIEYLDVARHYPMDRPDRRAAAAARDLPARAASGRVAKPPPTRPLSHQWR